jgi:hypothetical protein
MTTPLVTLTAAQLLATGPLSVACPTCGAAVGDPCASLRTTAGGARQVASHIARRIALLEEEARQPHPADDAPPRRPIRRAPTLQVTGTTPEQQQRWKDSAARQGMTLAAWMRAACDKFASSDT